MPVTMLHSSLIMPGSTHWPSIIKAEARTLNAGKIFTPKDHLHKNSCFSATCSLLPQKARNPLKPHDMHPILRPFPLCGKYFCFPSAKLYNVYEMIHITFWQTGLFRADEAFQ